MMKGRNWCPSRLERDSFSFPDNLQASKGLLETPPWYLEVTEKMEDLARSAGFYIPEMKEKEEAWRTAIMRVGATLGRYGVPMPAIPELGITGEEIKDLKEDDFVPVF